MGLVSERAPPRSLLRPLLTALLSISLSRAQSSTVVPLASSSQPSSSNPCNGGTDHATGTSTDPSSRSGPAPPPPAAASGGEVGGGAGPAPPSGSGPAPPPPAAASGGEAAVEAKVKVILRPANEGTAAAAIFMHGDRKPNVRIDRVRIPVSCPTSSVSWMGTGDLHLEDSHGEDTR